MTHLLHSLCLLFFPPWNPLVFPKLDEIPVAHETTEHKDNFIIYLRVCLDDKYQRGGYYHSTTDLVQQLKVQTGSGLRHTLSCLPALRQQAWVSTEFPREPSAQQIKRAGPRQSSSTIRVSPPLHGHLLEAFCRSVITFVRHKVNTNGLPPLLLWSWIISDTWNGESYEQH